LPEKPPKLISEEDYEPVSRNRSGLVRLSCGQIAQCSSMSVCKPTMISFGFSCFLAFGDDF
jgi:hypothetical protein